MKRQKWLTRGVTGLLYALSFPLIISPPAEAGRTVIIRRTERSDNHRPTVHEDQHHRGRHRHRSTVHQRQRRRQVTVEFIAQGNEWANVYVNDRHIFSPRNTDRRKRFTFREGAYELKITGIDYFDVWAEGYLDIGRDDSNIVVVAFSEQGVRTVGDANAWIPVVTRR